MIGGDLRHRVEIQAPDPSSPRDSAGQVVTEYTTIARPYASIDPLSADETLIASQQQASTTHKIKMRWTSQLAAIDSSYRIKFGERIFTLDGLPMNPQEKNEQLVLRCTERTIKS